MSNKIKTLDELLKISKELFQKKYQLKNELDQINSKIYDINKLILEKCSHKKINKYRHYSGYERPTYYYECAYCKQNLSFDKFCSLKNPEVEDFNL